MALDVTVGGASSNSYGTHAAFELYRDARGWTDTGTDATDEINLIKATDHLDRAHAFTGYAANETQRLKWPRVTSILVDGWSFDSDEIPQDIIDAQFELAYLIQLGLNPAKTIAGTVKSAGAGPARVEFLGGMAKPRIVAIEGLLRPYLTHGASQVRAIRG